MPNNLPIQQEAEFLKREEIKTMARDIAGLREMEAKTEKERIVDLKPAEIKPQPHSPSSPSSPSPILPPIPPTENKPSFSFPYKKIIVRGIIILISLALLGFGFWFWQGKKPIEKKITPPIQEALPPQEPEEIIQPPIIQAPIIQDRLVTRGFRKVTGTRTIDTIIIYSVIKETPVSGTAFHYIIAKNNGTIYRLVADNNIAYHAGTGIMPDGTRKNTINSFSIGIGLVYGKDDSPSELQYQSLSNLIKYLRQQYNIPIENVLRKQDISPDKGINPLNFDWEKFNQLIQSKITEKPVGKIISTPEVIPLPDKEIKETEEVPGEQNILTENAYVIEDDGTLTANARQADVLTKKFYEKFPNDRYDFIAFLFRDAVIGKASYAFGVQPPARQGIFQPPNPTFSEVPASQMAAPFGSKGKLKGGLVSTFAFNDEFMNYGPTGEIINILDAPYFPLLFHELGHYWGVYVPEELKEVLPEQNGEYLQSHWDAHVGSWVAVGLSTRRKIIERNGEYYFEVNCTLPPKDHDFDLYSMGLKDVSEIKDKVIAAGIAGYLDDSGNYIRISLCGSQKLPAERVKKVFTIKDVVNVLGPRIPSVAEAQKDFTIAFVFITPQNASPTLQEIGALNWIAQKFPVAWYKNTEGRSILNGIRPEESNPPQISGVKVSTTKSSITINFTTNEPAASFVIYSEPNVSYISPNVVTAPPNFSTKHAITIMNGELTPLQPGSKYPINIIVIDKNYNSAAFDAGIVNTKE
ncbi:MAG: N-acetylmuramoyl-L-alanine amidase [Patescibacteria group bacterium]